LITIVLYLLGGTFRKRFQHPPGERAVIKKILFGLALLLAIFLIVVALQPDEFRISRSAAVAAAPQQVFEQVNDFHKWEAWSPWAKLDPNAKATFEGPPTGEGAVFIWAGNSEVGEGRMTVTQSRPNELIRIKLDFVKPMEGTSDVEFTFKPQNDDTVVTWTMSGRNNFIGKAICLIMNQDKMIGGYFEKGLANLKSVAETPRKT
jgi:uncharacterized protein YndB with AHSA1/START domain